MLTLNGDNKNGQSRKQLATYGTQDEDKLNKNTTQYAKKPQT